MIWKWMNWILKQKMFQYIFVPLLWCNFITFQMPRNYWQKTSHHKMQKKMIASFILNSPVSLQASFEWQLFVLLIANITQNCQPKPSSKITHRNTATTSNIFFSSFFLLNDTKFNEVSKGYTFLNEAMPIILILFFLLFVIKDNCASCWFSFGLFSQ